MDHCIFCDERAEVELQPCGHRLFCMGCYEVWVNGYPRSVYQKASEARLDDRLLRLELALDATLDAQQRTIEQELQSASNKVATVKCNVQPELSGLGETVEEYVLEDLQEDVSTEESLNKPRKIAAGMSPLLQKVFNCFNGDSKMLENARLGDSVARHILTSKQGEILTTSSLSDADRDRDRPSKSAPSRFRNESKHRKAGRRNSGITRNQTKSTICTGRSSTRHTIRQKLKGCRVFRQKLRQMVLHEMLDDAHCAYCSLEKDEPLISPCACKGNTVYHLSCVLEWIWRRHEDLCRQCRSKYSHPECVAALQDPHWKGYYRDVASNDGGSEVDTVDFGDCTCAAE